MAARYRLTGEKKEKNRHTLHRVYWIEDDREGGWIADGVTLHGRTTLYGDAEIYGGIFRSGIIRGGRFYGGTFRGGMTDTFLLPNT